MNHKKQQLKTGKTQKKIIHDAIQHVYPAIQINNRQQIWNMKGYEHSATEEKTKYLATTNDRQKLQHGITKLDNEIRHMEKKKRIENIFTAWKTATQFLKTRKHDIILAKQPIIILCGSKRNKNTTNNKYENIKITT